MSSSGVPVVPEEPEMAVLDQRGARSQPFVPLLLVLFGATVMAQLLSLAFGRANQELSFAAMVLPSVLFLSVVTLPLAASGLVMGRQIGLGAPLIAALLERRHWVLQRLKKEVLLAALLGLALGGLLLLVRVVSAPHLPAEMPKFGHRGVVGGLAVSLGAAVAEEVWFRLGLMTLLLWVGSRILGDREVRPAVAWPAIVTVSIAFGLMHLPQLTSYGAGSPFAIAGTIAGNSVVGTLYGWCYWRKSLLAAIVAHFSVDLVLHVLPALG